MQRLIQIAKWAWVILLMVGAGWYLSQYSDEAVAELKRISPQRVAASLMLLVIGRLLIVQLARDAVATSGSAQPYTNMLRMVALSELGKYLPGGIWHFVGRTGYYRAGGMTVTQAARAIFTEHFWLTVSSALGGSLLLVIYREASLTGLAIPLLAGLWIAFIILTLRQTALKPNALVIIRLLLLQSAVWLCLGGSYVVLLPVNSPSELTLTLGAFAVSWLIGFLMILAPGGIGVREAAISVLMLPLFPVQTTLVLASVHRLLWLGVELILGAVALLIASPANPIQTRTK